MARYGNEPRQHEQFLQVVNIHNVYNGLNIKMAGAVMLSQMLIQIYFKRNQNINSNFRQNSNSEF